MKDTRNFDRAPLKDIRVKDNQVGIRTPQILISRNKGDYMKGDVLDANATAELAKSIHIPDIDKINQKFEQTVNKDQIGKPNGVASLDSTGNVPIGQLSNIDTGLFIVVSELPTEDIKEGKIYCIKDTSSTAQDNGYIEYAYINNKWEKVGQFQAEPDLSQCAKLNDSNQFAETNSFNQGLKTMLLFKSNNGYLKSAVSSDSVATGLAYTTNGGVYDINNKLDKNEYQADKTNLTAAINNASTAANDASDAASNANAAAQNVNNAIEQAMRVDAELSGNVLTITNNQGIQKSVNLTDSDEHVTINMISNVEGVSLEGVVVDVYINNGSTPLQYTTPSSGQIEFTVTKGATYKVVFPDVRDCASVNPVQYTAAVGNRIIDAKYNKLIAFPEHVTIQLIKHDSNGNQIHYQNASVVVTIGKEDPVTYNTDDNGSIEIDIPYGSTYTVEAPHVTDYYILNNIYTKSYEANLSSRIIKYNYYLYKTGLYIVTDTGNEYSLEEWQSGNYDVSSAKLIKLANEQLNAASNTIYLRISDIINNTSTTKLWCTKNFLFTSISKNGNNLSDALYYKGKESSYLILNEAEEKTIEVPAFTYAKSQSIEIGGRTIHGYIGSVGQWYMLWANRDGIDDILTELYGDDAKLFSALTSNKCTSTQMDIDAAYAFSTEIIGIYKTVYRLLIVPFFAY